MTSVLVVDDAPDTLEVLQRTLSGEGFRVYAAREVAEALRVLAGTAIDLVITDLRMPRATGLELVRHVRENLPDTAVIMLTGYASVQGAVEALKTGAEEYLAKPYTDEELLGAVRRTLEALCARRSARSTGEPMPAAHCGLAGESPAVAALRQAIAKAAASNATVLITGESGTGKELVARAIHYGGKRAAAPFVPVNCGAIPEGLLESELFGYVKGAFTGAAETRAGFFLTSDGGTLFLDEVSNTGLAMQAKLLRVLQDKEVSMVGDPRACKVDVRILAATNKDLAALVRKGLFREDLYYRLNVIVLEVPPLRDRPEDVPVLARLFAARFAQEHGRSAPGFTDGALRVLRAHDWPGNVRELENLTHRLIAMTEADPIDIPDLPAAMRYSAERGAGLGRTLAQVEAEHIRNVLASVDGNRTRAAELLGIDRKTLRARLESLS